MVDVRMKFSPPLVGGRGLTGPQGASIAGATVNPVTGHLILSLSSGVTLDAGAVSAEKATYTIDLSSGAAAVASVSVTRDNEALAQTGVNTAQVVPADTPIVEMMDGWTGAWSHKAITNLVAWNFATGFTDVGSPTVATGQADPTGGTSAIKVTDANGAATAYRYVGGTTYAATLWAHADATNPPTVPGCVTANLGAVDTATTEAVPATNTAWTRLEFGAGKRTFYGYLDAIQMIPAGAAAPGSFTVSATGAAHYYWPFATTSVTNQICPVAKTTLPATGLPLVPAAVSALGLDGTLDLEVEILPSWTNSEEGILGCYLWSANAGAHSLRMDSFFRSLILKINGSDRITAFPVGNLVADATQASVRGQLVRVRTWWDPLRGEAGIRMSVGGVIAFDKTVTPSGTPLAPITSFWLGSNGASTSNVATLRFRRLVTRLSASRAFVPQGILMGDSTMASFDVLGVGAVSGWIYQGTEQEIDRARCIAVPGENATQQAARWAALPLGERSSAAWVLFQLGLNDLTVTTDSAATITARLQALVTAIRSVNATCKIIAGQMTPCAKRWTDLYGGTVGPQQQAKWVTINANIAGTGPNPLTGVDAVVSDYVTTLAEADASGDLADIYQVNPPDEIHENNTARQIIAADDRAVLSDLGLI